MEKRKGIQENDHARASLARHCREGARTYLDARKSPPNGAKRIGKVIGDVFSVFLVGALIMVFVFAMISRLMH